MAPCFRGLLRMTRERDLDAYKSQAPWRVFDQFLMTKEMLFVNENRRSIR